MKLLPRRHRLNIVAALLCVLVLLTTTALAIGRSRELSYRSYCAASLRGLSQSMIVYSSENADVFPLVPGTSDTDYDITLKPEKVEGTADEVLHGCYDKPNRHQGNLGAILWIMVLKQQCTPKQFICRSDPDASERPARTVVPNSAPEIFYSNFSAATLSYSMAYPWQKNEKKQIVAAPWWKNTVDASLPLLSDMAPYIDPKGKKEEVLTLASPPRLRGAKPAATQGTTTPATSPDTGIATLSDDEFAPSRPMKSLNSENHGGDGQTVAYGDCHAAFERSPKIGQNQDDIWTRGTNKDEQAVPGGKLPQALTATETPFDIVMVPVRTAKGEVR